MLGFGWRLLAISPVPRTPPPAEDPFFELRGLGPAQSVKYRCWYDESYVDDPTWWFFPHVCGRSSPAAIARAEAEAARMLLRSKRFDRDGAGTSASAASVAAAASAEGYQVTPDAAGSIIAAREKSARDAFALYSRKPLVLASTLPSELLKNPSGILIPAEWKLLCRWLPLRFSAMSPVLTFVATRDGFNLGSLFLKVQAAGPLVIIIQSAAIDLAVGPGIFGAFVPNVLRPTPGKYYGTGEAFLWRINPDPEKFEWVPGQKNFFLHVERKSFSIGGGKGVGLWVDDELSYGWSERCQTFRNEPLNVGSTQFDILNLEVISFTSSS